MASSVSHGFASRRPRRPSRLALETLAGKAAETVTLAAQLLVLPALLGPVAYGDFALVAAFVSTGALTLAVGGPTVLTRFVPAAGPERRVAVARAIAARLALTRGLAAAAVVAVAATVLLADPSAAPVELVAIGAAALVAELGATLAFQVALAFGRTGLWNGRYPVQNAVFVLAAAALSGFGAVGASTALAGAAGAAMAVGGAVAHRLLTGGSRARVAVPPGALRFGAVFAVGSLVLFGTQRGAVLAVSALDDRAEQAGFCGVAVGVALAGTYAIGQLFAVRLPRLAAIADSDPAAAATSVRRAVAGLVALTVPVAVLGSLVAGPLLGVLLGSRYDGAGAAVAVALASWPLAPLGAAVSQLSALRLTPWPRVWSSLAGAATFVPAALVLVPDHGALGGLEALVGATAISGGCGAALVEGVGARSVAGALAGAAVAVACALAVG